MHQCPCFIDSNLRRPSRNICVVVFLRVRVCLCQQCPYLPRQHLRTRIRRASDHKSGAQHSRLVLERQYTIFGYYLLPQISCMTTNPFDRKVEYTCRKLDLYSGLKFLKITPHRCQISETHVVVIIPCSAVLQKNRILSHCQRRRISTSPKTHSHSFQQVTSYWLAHTMEVSRQALFNSSSQVTPPTTTAQSALASECTPLQTFPPETYARQMRPRSETGISSNDSKQKVRITKCPTAANKVMKIVSSLKGRETCGAINPTFPFSIVTQQMRKQTNKCVTRC